jgi:hypothetical protein
MVDEFRSHMTASATPQQPEVPIDGKVSTLGKTAIPNDIAMSQQVAEVADSKQEWEICDIISKEDVDGVVHYLVQWEATLVPKYELGKAKALVEKFEARLRAQARQRNGKRRNRVVDPGSMCKASYCQGQLDMEKLQRSFMCKVHSSGI